MKKRVFRINAALRFCLCIWIITPMLANANESSSEDDWRFTPAIYLWVPIIKTTTKAGNDIEVSRKEVLEGLDFAVMGAFEVRKSKLWAAADVIYIKLSTDKAGEFSGPLGPRDRANLNVNINADIDIKGLVVNLTGGRNVWESEALTVDIFAGARFLGLDTETRVNLDANLSLETRIKTITRGASRELTILASDSVWDGIVGVKGKVTIYENWYLPYYADVGTGESDITWQAAGGLGYDFDGVNVVLMYRHLSWEFNDKIFKDISFSGPMLGASFRF